MKIYDDKHIKNVVLVGAPKSGKTTLAEAMIFEAGLINRRGTVEEKNTVSDYHEIEHERGNSVYATSLHTEWKDYKINIIDTPGLDDFIGEVISSLRVADTAVMLLNAEHGVEIGTELIWNYVEKFQKPIIFAINHLDHSKADFEDSLMQAKNRFGKAITLMQYPISVGDGFNAIIDLLNMVMYKFPATGGKPEKLPIPADEIEKANQLHNELVEKAAENDDKLMELYFEKGTLDEDELLENFFKAAKSNDVAAAEDIIESAVFRGLKESVNLTDAFGNSPLMICAQRNWSDSITILLANDHCDVNHQNIFGSSALMCSSSHGHMDALKVLLSCSRVEVDLVSRFGQTALMKAAQAGKLTSIQVLLTKGANATLLNKQGKGVIQIAEEKGHDKVADFFSKYEANKNIDVFAKSVFSPV